jgi:4-amino-4-deoxy-L-arabinose transferase-like glycosyltransferase
LIPNNEVANTMWFGVSQRAKAGIIALVALNLLVALIYAWALTYHTRVEVELLEDGYSAQVEGTSLAISSGRPDHERVVLLLEDWPKSPARADASWLQESVRPIVSLVASLLGPSWTQPEVAGGLTVESDAPQPQRNIGSLKEQSNGRSVVFKRGEVGSVQAEVTRGWGIAAVGFIDPDSGNGYVFWHRPFHQDMGWDLIEEGRRSSTVTSGGFRLPFMTALATTMVSLITSYFLGWILLVIAIVLAFISVPLVGSIFQRVKEDLSAAMASSALQWTLAAAIALGGLLITAAAATLLLRRIPHVQDSVTYLFQAQTLALGRLSVPPPPLPDFFHQEFILSHNGMWFGKYPLGHPALLTLGVWAGAPWLVGPVLGAGFLILIFWLGREMYGAKTGLIAALMVLFSPFFIFLSASFMAHSTSLFFVALFVIGFVKTRKSRTIYWPIFAGGSLGLVFLTRPLTAATISLPFIAVALVSLLSHPRANVRRYAPMALAGFVPVGLLFGYNWAMTGHPFLSPHEIWWGFDKIGFGQGIGMHGPHSPAQGLVNTWRNLSQLQQHLFGWPPYITLALLFLPFATLRAKRYDWLLLAGAFSLIFGHALYWADGIMFGPRYYYEALPMLALLTARGAVIMAGMSKEIVAKRLNIPLWSAKGWQPSGALAGGLILTALLSYNLFAYLPGQITQYRNYNYVNADAQETILGYDLRQALVFVEDDPEWYWWKYGQLFSANTPLLDSEIIFARDLGEVKNQELMAAFPDRTPYLWDGYQLEPLQHNEGEHTP